jgi:Tfp pilus assembly protein PilF
MRSITHILQSTQRTQQLRARAQRLWWQAQIARLAGDQQRYQQLMRQHEPLLTQIHQALTEPTDDRPE